MIHFYSDPLEIYSLDWQERRLGIARAIADADVPCVVWAEDALAFAHCVPTLLFDLQILVPDKLVAKAASVLTSHRDDFELDLLDTPSPRWLEYRVARDKAGKYAHALPDSAYLAHPLQDQVSDSMAISGKVWTVEIHPQSAFQFDVEDLSCSMTLVPPFPPSYASVRFPIRSAFLDALIATHIDNPMPYNHHKFHKRIKCYIEYLALYTLRLDDYRAPDGLSLRPEAEALIKDLRPENRPYMRDFLMLKTRGKSIGTYREERHNIMKAAVRTVEPRSLHVTREPFNPRRAMSTSAPSARVPSTPVMRIHIRTMPTARWSGFEGQLLNIGRKVVRRG